VKLVSLLLTISVLASCDFTPPLNKKILDAQNLIRDNQYEEAISRYVVILKNNPPAEIKVKIRYQIADLYSIYLSKIEESLPYYEEVAKTSEDERWKLKSLERLSDLNFTHLKRYDKAIFYFREMLYLTTDKTEIDFFEYRIAQSYFKKSDFQNAIQKFAEISNNKTHSYYVKSIYYQAMVHYYLEEWDQSIKLFQNYIGIEKNRDDVINAKFILANALESRENLNKAYDIYSSILGEYPNTEVVKAKLESIYRRRVARKRN
jgi:tetratricopeptide (TPR) repeat protein